MGNLWNRLATLGVIAITAFTNPGIQAQTNITGKEIGEGFKEDICKEFPVQDVTNHWIDMEWKDTKFEDGYMYYSMGSKLFKIPVKPKKGTYQIIDENLNPDLKPVQVSNDHKKTLILLEPRNRFPEVVITWRTQWLDAISVNEECKAEQSMSLDYVQSVVKTGKYLVIFWDSDISGEIKVSLMVYNQENGNMDKYTIEEINKVVWNSLSFDEQKSGEYNNIVKILESNQEDAVTLDFSVNNKEKNKRQKTISIDKLIKSVEEIKK